MFIFIKKMLIRLSSFGGSLVGVSQVSNREVSDCTKCISSNNQPCQVRPTLIDVTCNESPYYLFVASVNKCGEICNTVDD